MLHFVLLVTIGGSNDLGLGHFLVFLMLSTGLWSKIFKTIRFLLHIYFGSAIFVLVGSPFCARNLLGNFQLLPVS